MGGTIGRDLALFAGKWSKEEGNSISDVAVLGGEYASKSGLASQLNPGINPKGS
jgi:hypothetical protein